MGDIKLGELFERGDNSLPLRPMGSASAVFRNYGLPRLPGSTALYYRLLPRRGLLS